MNHDSNKSQFNGGGFSGHIRVAPLTPPRIDTTPFPPLVDSAKPPTNNNLGENMGDKEQVSSTVAAPESARELDALILLLYSSAIRHVANAVPISIKDEMREILSAYASSQHAALQQEIARLQQGLAWFAECVITDDRLNGTPDPQGWIARAKECADLRNADLAAKDAEVTRLTQERDDFVRARQVVRDGFKHDSRIDGKCQCCYCRGDLEQLVCHAADYEVKWFGENKEKVAAESRVHLLEAALKGIVDHLTDDFENPGAEIYGDDSEGGKLLDSMLHKAAKLLTGEQ